MQSFCQVSSARSGRESSHCNKVLMSVVKRSRKFFEKAPLSFVRFLDRIGTTIHRSQSQMELADEFESLTRVNCWRRMCCHLNVLIQPKVLCWFLTGFTVSVFKGECC